MKEYTQDARHISDIEDLYRGEVQGAAAFAAAARYSRNLVKREKFKQLMLMEEQTRLASLKLLARKGRLPPSTWLLVLRGELEGIGAALLPWLWVMRRFLKISEKYHPLYQRLFDQAHPEDRTFFAYVLRHEEAFRELAIGELGGRRDAIDLIRHMVSEGSRV